MFQFSGSIFLQQGKDLDILDAAPQAETRNFIEPILIASLQDLLKPDPLEVGPRLCLKKPSPDDAEHALVVLSVASAKSAVRAPSPCARSGPAATPPQSPSAAHRG